MPYPGEQHAVISNTFAHTTQYTAYTPDEVASLQCRLDKQLGPEYILSRDGPRGQKLHYIPAEKVINLANEVFGFNGWSTSIQNVTIDFVDEDTSGKITMGCHIVMRVTLKDGTYHEDIGYGEIRNAPSKAAAFEKTKKEAATDALKRALRTFGNILGNCLYDKSYLSKISKVRSVPAHWDAEELHRPTTAAASKTGSPAKKETMHQQKAIVAPSEHHLPRSKHEEDEFGADDFDDIDFAAEDMSEFVSETESKSNIPTKSTNLHSGLAPINAAQARPTASNASAISNKNHGQNDGSRQNHTPQDQRRSQGSMQPPNRGGHNELVPIHPQSNDQAVKHISQPQTTVPQAAQQSENTTQDRQLTGGPPQAPAMPLTFYRVTAAQRAVDEDFVPQLEDAKPFDPRTPVQMRRTTGVDHSRSGPISRQAVTTQSGVPAGQNVINERAPNFVNPQADANRRIGMPSPLLNRTSGFKPLSIANGKRGIESQGRSALADVSNIQDITKADVVSKKPRLDLVQGPDNKTSNA